MSVRQRPRHFGLAAVALLIAFGVGSCDTTESDRRRKRTLPGQGEVSSLGWGRPQPGDAQPGLGAFPQTR